MSHDPASEERQDRKRLTLVRHAKSSRRFGDLDDFRRPLNKRGLRECLKMPAEVARHLPRPDVILSSDSVRTVQTCQAIADVFELHDERIVLSNDLYLASHRHLLGYLRALTGNPRHVMLIGHNPGISDLCNHLLSTPVQDLSTFTVAALRLAISDWASLRRGYVRLERLMLPRELLNRQQTSNG